MTPGARRRVDRAKPRHLKRAGTPQATYPTFTLGVDHHYPTAARPITAANYSRYIGRVGALAVALGVGAAMSTGHGLGVAHADTDTTSGDSPSPESPSTSTQSTDTTTPTPSDNSSDSNTKTSEPDPADKDDDGMQVGNSGGLNNSTNDAGQATDENEDEDEDETTSTPATPTTEPEILPTEPVVIEETPEDVTTEEPETSSAPTQSVDNDSPSGTTPTADPEPADTDSSATETTPSETTEAPEALLSAAAHDAHSSTPDALSSTTTVPPTVNPLHSVLAPPRTVVELASAFVSALLAPILAPWPAPCEPPLLWALLSWVRREVQRTFFNRTPIVVPEEITLVLGPGQESNPIPFHVHDFDGDGLKYYVPTQGVPGGPRYGSVTVDQATGTYTYTPDEGFTGVDEFRVTASDAHTRFHMHGLLGFLRPHWGHTDTARIRVTVVAPGVQAPVVANDYYQTEQGNPLTGNVLANDSDPNGETLTAAPLTEPQYGKLTLGPDGSFHYEPDPDYHGEDAFSYTASNSELSSNARVEIVITPVNRAPVGVDDSYTTDEDTPVGGNVLDNDSDPDGDGMTAILDTPASHGSVHLNGDGSFTYTPHTNFVGEDTFSYVTHDGTQAGASTLVRITVTAVNDDPVATPDSYTIGEDSTLHGNVLTNDTDADGDPLTATVVSGPSHGGLQWNSNGSFTYTPNENYAGTDSFTYAVSDGQGGTATGAVSITVDAVNDAPVAANDSFTVDENGTLQGNVLTNDHDVDSTTLTPTVFSPPSHGTLTMNADGSFTYTPAANFHGTDTFSYTVSDGVATSAPALVVISVTPVDSAPVAVGDNFTIVEDSVLSGNVLSNDTDADRDSLIAELVSGPANGTLTFNADGTFTYKPAKNFAGTDSFTYTASDGTSDSGIGTVTITVTAVNDAPVAEDDFYSTQEDQSVSGNVLDNDSDVDDDTLTVSLDEPPAHGTVTLNPDGTFTYTPPPDFHGVDFFSYTTTDEVATTTPTLVIITVTPVNDPPVAVDDEYTINEDTVLTGNVLSNDSDLERNNLTAHLVDGPANGTVTLNPDGTFTYTPETGYNGPDSFTYYAFDGSASSEVSTVHITVRDVNYAPVANNDAVSTNEDTTRTGNVLTNDTDADGDQLTAQLVSGPAHGTLTLNPDGSYSYTPNANFNGTDTFTYTASDSFATSNTATVTITVIAVNDPPVPGSDSYTIGEDTTLTGNVLANDSDPEADLLAVELLSDAANGTLTLNADGSFSYTPTLNFNGTDTFTYTVSDGRGGTAVGTVSITVEASNDPPVASDDSVATDEDDAFTGSFPVSDVDSSTITSSVVAGPANGQLVLHDDGTYTYTPNADFNGTDSFTYRATDAEGAISTVATISITVRPVNDAPVASDDSIVTDEDAPYSGSVSTSDIDGDTVTTAVDQDVEHGTLVLNADGTFTYTPDENFYGTDSFTYRASDGNGGLTTGTVTITVEAVNDAATPVDDAYSTDEDTPLTIPAAGGVLGN
ncbi:tandem-95 repeat protein, partial [Mycolicibacterium flavescens]